MRPARLGLPVESGTYRITSGFGPRGNSMHRGIDFAHRVPGQSYAGAEVLAMEDGDVVEARQGVSGFEVWVWLRHTIAGQRVDTIYGHMPWSSVRVRAGDKVKRGQYIADVGSEGDSSAPHLHAEVWVGGRVGGTAVDPQPWMES